MTIKLRQLFRDSCFVKFWLTGRVNYFPVLAPGPFIHIHSNTFDQIHFYVQANLKFILCCPGDTIIAMVARFIVGHFPCSSEKQWGPILFDNFKKNLSGSNDGMNKFAFKGIANCVVYIELVRETHDFDHFFFRIRLIEKIYKQLGHARIELIGLVNKTQSEEWKSGKRTTFTG